MSRSSDGTDTPPPPASGDQPPTPMKTPLSDESEEEVIIMVATPRWRAYTSLAIMCVINLLCYMDRYTVAGVLTKVQDYFGIKDAEGGLVQTVFIAFYVVFAPACGFLGDRYNRKLVMTGGVAIWIAAVFASSFVPDNMFWLFLVLRGIVAIGEASYAIISPTMIGDMFIGTSRSRALAIFYFALPVGSGMGYMVGSTVANLASDWRWGVRATAVPGILCLLAIIFFIRDPPRGHAEQQAGATAAMSIEKSSYWSDVKALIVNPTYVLATIAYTEMVFVTGTLAWWVPTAIEHAKAWDKNLTSTDDLTDDEKNQVSLVFGAITVAGGIAGVAIGTTLAWMMKRGKWCCRPFKTQRADCIICAIGAFIALPTFFGTLQLLHTELTAAYALIFITITALCFNWAINVDLLLNVVIPPRRNTANALQILVSHLFGDGSGPYVVGLISDAIRGSSTTPESHYRSLQKSFYLPNAALILAGAMSIASAFTFPKDHAKFRKIMGYDDEKTELEKISPALSDSKSKSLSLSPEKKEEKSPTGATNDGFQTDTAF